MLRAQRLSRTCSTSRRGLFKFFSKVKVEFFMEVLADALKQLLTTISLVCPRGFFCASQVSHVRQPKLDWTSFVLFPVWERRLVPKEVWNSVVLETNVGNCVRWISDGVSQPAGNDRARLPTAVGGKPQRHPLGEPAGIGKCEDEALERWILNNCSVPPCSCILDQNGCLRRPCVAEN